MCGVLFAFHSNYGSILYHFRDKARYWSQIAILSYPAFDAPVRGVPVGILPHRLACKKTRMVWLPDGEETVRICLVVLIEHRRVANKRTDIR